MLTKLFDLVLMSGFEPPRPLRPRDFKSLMSPNFITWAIGRSERNRTLKYGVEARCFAIKLHSYLDNDVIDIIHHFETMFIKFIDKMGRAGTPCLP